MTSATPLFPRKPVFERALAALAHPLSLAALGLMLLNDALLRQWIPSWWTGKLSDLAWLVITPLLLTALLGWLLPARRAPWAMWISLLVCGLGFTLVKTIPGINALATQIILPLLHQTPALSFDPSDLLALPGLILAAWIWRAAQIPPMYPAHPSRLSPYHRAVRGLVILPLAALLLLADAAAPDFGIICFSREGDSITAGAGYNAFVSSDGGQTWSPKTGGANCQRQTDGSDEPVSVNGPKEGVLYRFIQGNSIERSTDGGTTFQNVYKVTPVSQQEEYYYIKTHSGTVMVQPGPFSAIADPASGNMLFAMGQQGILIHKPDGTWIWSPAGDYQPAVLSDSSSGAAMFGVLLGGVLLLAVVLALLIYATLALRWTFHWLRLTVLILGWLAWLGVAILFLPVTAYSYAEGISMLGLAIAGLLALPLAIEQTVRLVRRAPRKILGLLGLGLLGGLLYFLPYVLWLYNTLPAIDTATLIALVLSAMVLAAGAAIFLRKPARVG